MTWAILGSVAIVCVSRLLAYRWELDARPQDETISALEDRIDDALFKLAHQPEMPALPCTREEFTRVVNQMNTLTRDMETVSQTADSLRSAMSAQAVMGGKRT